jgi:hypothetical protein
MAQGQPALLYLVPATLGAMWWRALRRNEVSSQFVMIR